MKNRTYKQMKLAERFGLLTAAYGKPIAWDDEAGKKLNALIVQTALEAAGFN